MSVVRLARNGKSPYYRGAMSIKKLLSSAAAALFTLIAVPDDAAAFTGYVCEAQFRHYSGYGQHGYVYVSAYSQPGCTGNWVVGAVFCTTGGTGSLCSQDNLQTAPSIQALIQNLQRAAAARQKVNIAAQSNGAGHFVSFFSN
jgi:hypothetical protein